MDTVDSFEDLIEQALTAHFQKRPDLVLWLGDGAKGYWNIAKRVCPTAQEILDWYHAILHASDAAKLLLGDSPQMQCLWIDVVEKTLRQPSGIDTLLDDLEDCLLLAQNDSERKAIKELRRYYKNNRHRMDYSRYLQNGWPIGSGSIESAHRYVLQARMKRAGQHWNPKNADKMAKMRACYQTAGPKQFHNAIKRAQKSSNMAAKKKTLRLIAHPRKNPQ